MWRAVKLIAYPLVGSFLTIPKSLKAFNRHLQVLKPFLEKSFSDLHYKQT